MVGQEYRTLSPDEAREHPLYGIDGWLLAILVLGALLEIGKGLSLVGAHPLNWSGIYGPAGMLVETWKLAGFFALAVLLVFGFMKSPQFPRLVTLLLGIDLGIIAIATLFALTSDLADASKFEAFGLGIFRGGADVLLLRYFLTSVRVNVTYLKRRPVAAAGRCRPRSPCSPA